MTEPVFVEKDNPGFRSLEAAAEALAFTILEAVEKKSGPMEKWHNELGSELSEVENLIKTKGREEVLDSLKKSILEQFKRMVKRD